MISRAKFKNEVTNGIVIEAFALPKFFTQFSSFYGSKQSLLDCPELFFRRVSKAEDN